VVGLGVRIVECLDDAGIRLSVAVWMSSSEFEDGRLVLSSTSLDQIDLLGAYEKVTLALQGHFSVQLPPILILSMRDPFIRELRRLFGKTKSVEGMRLGGQTVGNRFIEQAYVFRIR
jgi:hypothetical protein